jgi:hypothetical protein
MILRSGMRPACRTLIDRAQARFPVPLFLDFPESMYMRLKLQWGAKPEGSSLRVAFSQTNLGGTRSD